jgi:DnaJ-class molecular chaperone
VRAFHQISEVCPQCGGSGVVVDLENFLDVRCPKCEGLGEIFREESEDE